MIGKLVKRKRKKDHKFWGLGIVLDHRSTGRFYPSTELTIHFPTSKRGSVKLRLDIKSVEFLDESR